METKDTTTSAAAAAFITTANKRRLGYVGAMPGAPKRDSDSWYTPEAYLDAARVALGGVIDLDPFSSTSANKRVKANRIFTVKDDGLAQAWDATTVFMNPPYSGKLCALGVNKFLDEYKRDSFQDGVFLVNNATETRWFQRALSETNAVCFTNHRISFLNEDGKRRSGNTRGQTFFYVGRRAGIQRFISEFSKFGVVVLIP